MLRYEIERREFHFKEPAGTSRGIYTRRVCWFVTLRSGDETGVGECAPLPRLSCDDVADYEPRLQAFCEQLCATGEIDYDGMNAFPSMLFGLETAMAQLRAHGSFALFDTPFARGEEGIPFNGLVWMGDYETMARRMEQKLRQGHRCVKIKIGAIDFNEELALIARLRRDFPAADGLQLRVDANGAFSAENVMAKLEQLAKYDIHSIEQPIAAGQRSALAEVCRRSPIAVALDEELIGVNTLEDRQRLLEEVMPQYIVLKPSLHGGMRGTEQWISEARRRGIGSWITSALESNIGLNAIAQLTARIYGSGIRFAQGLGTGQLFTDNVDVPLVVRAEGGDVRLFFHA